uniref:Uncharacterized protein n=1 Tax=Hyaloperonospora arabidopsidis (strain Emoy2) TaxID=559515 RepID=M4BQT4_HYAAE
MGTCGRLQIVGQQTRPALAAKDHTEHEAEARSEWGSSTVELRGSASLARGVDLFVA